MGNSSTLTAAQPADPGFLRAHQALLVRHDLQFDLKVLPTPPAPPPWLKALLQAIGQVLKTLAPVFKLFFWVALGLAVCAVVFFLARELLGLGYWRKGARRAKTPISPTPEWRPAPARAASLLQDADRLAAEGRFEEAVHLILFRSVEDIDARWPNLVRPALTSRDIAAHPVLPPVARTTFAGIAQVVERSFFGGDQLGAEDFAACRQAYSAFALPAAA